MDEQELFRRTFDKLHASAGVEKEILAMYEKKRMHPLRPIAAAAVCLAVMVCSAFAADAATGGAFFRSIRTVFGMQTIRQEVVHADGVTAAVFTQIDGEYGLPDGAVSSVNLGEKAGAYLTEDGRVMLREEGKEDQDVTEAWAQGGTFSIGGEDFTVETFADSSGNRLYKISVLRNLETDVDQAFLYGGLLFDADRYDWSVLPGLEMGDIETGGEGEIQTYTFTAKE